MPDESENSIGKHGRKQWEKLPGFQEIDWPQTKVGRPQDWPLILKSISALISTFPHPAAIYWSSDLAVIVNDTWHDLKEGLIHIGQAQADRLNESACESLRRVLIRNEALSLEPALIFDHYPKDFHLFCSPILDPEDDKVSGVLAQLVPNRSLRKAKDLVQAAIDNPKQHGKSKQSIERTKSSIDIHGDESENDQSNEKGSNGEDDKSKWSEKDDQGGGPIRGKAGSTDDVQAQDRDKNLDDVPLDKHPFFKRFAALLPTGIAILNQKAEAVFVNKQFYELTVHAEADQTFGGWPHTIHDDDKEKVMKLYKDAFDKQESSQLEFRTRAAEQWRLLLLSPLGDDNLQHASLRKYGGFICAIVDITSQKKAELHERQAAKEARERKEQQERFIDMISHEIRNPLSAVLHCTEDILDAIKAHKEDDDKAQIVEAADTIALCVKHQKNIVDDILSFSKLDASMLSLSPKDSRPNIELVQCLKMFQPEFRKQKITFEYKLDHSYEDHHVGWVKADIVRISQVVVNLITNAVKFTAKQNGKKEVSVALGVSVKRPTSYPPNVVFFDTEDSNFRMDGTLTTEWGQGEVLYIMVAVTDTGIGIDEEGQKKLFERFRQATPRTQEVYGGSGLGLNIARKLCHLHGGEIGVKSEEGKGSTFGFFFKVKRTESGGEGEGEGEGSTEPDAEKQTDEDEMKDEIMNTSKMAKLSVSDDDIPESLRNPKPQKAPEMDMDGQQDDNYQSTKEVAKEVKGGKGVDEYSDAQQVRNTIQETTKDLKKDAKAEGNVDQDQDQNYNGDGKSVSADKTDKDDSNDSNDKSKTRPPPQDGDKGKIKVLLVEDNVINARILKRKLESKGYFVHGAVNGREGVDAVQKAFTDPKADDETKGYDIILMDQEMPIMDGLAASKAIRKWETQMNSDNDKSDDREGKQHSTKIHVPILGVSANVRDEHRDRMAKAGIDDFLGKPYAIGDIVDKIQALLSKKDKERRSSGGEASSEDERKSKESAAN